MKKRKYLAYVFLAVGLMNVISLFDTILSDPNISFTIFSIPTSKTINIAFYAILSLILLYAGIGEYKKNLNQNKK